MPKLIPLTQGQYAIVDAKYYDALVAMGKWCFLAKYGYAVKRERGHKSRLVYMHHAVLMLAGVGQVRHIDHRDRDKLNNRRRNLRAATSQQNNRNASRRKDNSSGFKGVCWSRSKQKWQAQIGIDGRIKFLGRFGSRVEAARAYDRAARKHFGRFAFLNFPRP